MELTAEEVRQIKAQRAQTAIAEERRQLVTRAQSMFVKEVLIEATKLERMACALREGLRAECTRCQGSGERYDILGDLCSCSGCGGKGWNRRED